MHLLIEVEIEDIDELTSLREWVIALTRWMRQFEKT